MNLCTVNKVVERVRAYVAREKLSKNRLAAMAGIQDTTLRKFDRPDWNPTLETLRKVEGVLPADFDPDKRNGRPNNRSGK